MSELQIIEPHRRPSRLVLPDDIERVKELAPQMAELCNQPLGKKSGAKALAHCQVDKKDPLRFFVLANGDAIVNPQIELRSGRVYSLEGCMFYPFRSDMKIKRFDQITVSYLLITADGKEKDVPELRINHEEGPLCFIFQHEIDHFNGLSIYS